MHISKAFTILNRPEYILRPSQVYRRILRKYRNRTKHYESILLPWKATITVRPTEAIGRAIWQQGIYDLSVTEALWRLTEPKDFAIDVGANIGYTTSILAKRVEQYGKVWSFEPHPEVYKELEKNVKHWKHEVGWSHITTYELALSNEDGIRTLVQSSNFSNNRGTAYFDSTNTITHDEAESEHYVSIAKLDTLLQSSNSIGVVKLDVEGHELQVLKGANELLSMHRARDIIFEDHNNYPTPVSNLLEGYGYQIYRLSRRFRGPFLESPLAKDRDFSWEPSNYLATIHPLRANSLFKRSGWYSLYNI